MFLHIVWQVLLFAYACLHLLGLLSSLHALLTARSSAAAIAWGISLLTFPILTLPLYWLFGRSRFQGYLQAIQAGSLERDQRVQPILTRMEPWHAHGATEARTFERLARFPITHNNRVKLLIDGQATYDDILAGIEQAQSHVLVSYFEIFNDEVGHKLRSALIERAQAGVQCTLIFDRMGCWELPDSYLEPLRQAGVQCHPFFPSNSKDYFQLNFRNHRKLVIVDGITAWTGGLNVGESYLGRGPRGPWRDTHVRLEGPAVVGMQLVFLEDYYFLTGKALHHLTWTPQAARMPGQDHNAVYVSNGPADDIDVGVLFFMKCIECAQNRLWLASPYFIPDPSVMDALHLAALRGVDVRLLLPARYDMIYMALAASTFMAELDRTRIKVYWYPTYAHQKVMLIDHHLAWVGSSNIDNRSMRLNFEGNLLVEGSEFNSQVADMLEADMQKSRLRTPNESPPGLAYRLAARLTRLFSPIL